MDEPKIDRTRLNEAFAKLESARRNDDMEELYTAAIEVAFYARMIELEFMQGDDGVVPT